MSSSYVFLEGDNTVFTELTYLGSAVVDAPRSETEISRNMKVLNAQSQRAIPVTLSVPAHSEGVVRLVVLCCFYFVFYACFHNFRPFYNIVITVFPIITTSLLMII